MWTWQLAYSNKTKKQPRCQVDLHFRGRATLQHFGLKYVHMSNKLKRISVLEEGRVIANQYKVLMSDHLYPVMKHLNPDGNGLFQDDSAPSHPPDLNLAVHLCRFWLDVLDSMLYHHRQNTSWGNIFWKYGFHCSSTVHETLPRHIKAVQEAHSSKSGTYSLIPAKLVTVVR